MTFCISTHDIQRICTPNAKTAGSVWHWTKTLPRERARLGVDGTGAARFRLSDLVPALRKTRKGLSGERLRALVDLDAPFDVSVPVEGDADTLLAALSMHESERYQRTAYRFSKAAAERFFDRFVHVGCEDILRKLILAGPVLRFVLTRDRSQLPVTDGEWTAFAAEFVLANSDGATIKKLSSNTKESAHEIA
ncbi:hypothetical protein PXK30_09465 [Phaeobacter gallaeciensis]|uniref:hypothetical protein n=1 Tax=Phaeobacter gallaeciensis TaxID=60890 RepID=UPI00237F72B7|nr:hypothetical protein [Phaeobacter gallaeciensis]MDE4303650.1 hypothetical protein [Phaeobacter gallaeciensis]MDE4307869.1 hypothetical protein [Phaeobacter gallaeciensis]MDE4312327.1 hypothetical protein [Phaeobacter gallaeciensis]MDE4316798.1 hypothetical protein [Phaeobacter gallaeciensis]MDE4321261.1 hypothetical protein [Phaeobacter gallaeciensis]